MQTNTAMLDQPDTSGSWELFRAMDRCLGCTRCFRRHSWFVFTPRAACRIWAREHPLGHRPVRKLIAANCSRTGAPELYHNRAETVFRNHRIWPESTDSLRPASVLPSCPAPRPQKKAHPNPSSPHTPLCSPHFRPIPLQSFTTEAVKHTEMSRQSHYSTPKKAGIRGTIEYLESRRIPHFKSDVFRFFGASYHSGWRALAEPEEKSDRTFHSAFADTRGRKKKISDEELAVIKRFIDSNGFDGRTVPWAALLAAAGLDIDVSADTVCRSVKDLNFRMCIACEKRYTSPRLKERRAEYSRVMLERYPNKEDWWHIRFSDECHFGWGPGGKIWVIRRPWERQYPDCLLEKPTPEEKDLRRVHCWAAVGYEFKSPLVWYDVPGNSNGKMTLQVYRDQILEPIVGEWLRSGCQRFVLEEDNDLGHGTSKRNIVRTWKEDNGLESFFNCASSPDFIPIEKAWQAAKQGST
ncbi:hypothetical protein VTI74DRAFT_5199 [Chaetomium olivicolor]